MATSKYWVSAALIVALLAAIYGWSEQRRPGSGRSDGSGGTKSSSEHVKSKSGTSPRSAPTSTGNVSRTANLANLGRELSRTTKDVPDVIELDDKHPGFYEQFRTAVDFNPVIRKSLRKCLLKVPDGTTEVAFTIVLRFEQTGNSATVDDASMEYEGLGIDDYMSCARSAYLAAEPTIALPSGWSPGRFVVKTTGRFVLTGPSTPEEIHQLLTTLYDELASASDDAERAIIQQSIDLYECIARRGIEHKRECILE